MVAVAVAALEIEITVMVRNVVRVDAAVVDVAIVV